MINKNISGWILIDKPIGVTSNYVLQKIKKIFKNKKAGYVGTLDPLASGFLPVAIGKATKVISYIENVNKKYVFVVQWGIKTETGDSEGKIIQTKQKYPNEKEIKDSLKYFVGQIEQRPPRFSSVKINGSRAYELARKNIQFKTKTRKVTIDEFELLKKISKNKALFYVECSSGTYVRSLAESIAQSLGTLGTLTELRRIGFSDCNKKLISLDYLLSIVHSDDLISLVHPIDVVFGFKNYINLDHKQMKKVLTGNCIKMSQEFMRFNMKEDIVFAKYESELVAIGSYENKSFQPKKLLISHV
ncbi:MAG: tRNA pseudouridine(55) synthase TruB [Pelagibacteraceae bacterium TMED65]|nr:tRNA pseudouridine(55) synthase TruB [Rickettsiales bacterium]OUU52023.1 MAG: tRNA pseudouridine(55) synthase TruB [Pelagibacteraceae bacterium TMED65]|tara:strand:- start:2789 stop:3694 length:906 start_codon:yes stop_codon:yes gene_type:complete